MSKYLSDRQDERVGEYLHLVEKQLRKYNDVTPGTFGHAKNVLAFMVGNKMDWLANSVLNAIGSGNASGLYVDARAGGRTIQSHRWTLGNVTAAKFRREMKALKASIDAAGGGSGRANPRKRKAPRRKNFIFITSALVAAAIAAKKAKGKKGGKAAKKNPGMYPPNAYGLNTGGAMRHNPRRRRNDAASRKYGKRMFITISPGAARKATWGTGSERSYNEKLAKLAGKTVEVDTEYIFADQFNLKAPHNLRVHLRDISQIINDQRKGRAISSWSHKHGPRKGTPGHEGFRSQELASIRASKGGKPEDEARIDKMIRPFYVTKPKPAKAFGRGWTYATVKRVYKNKNVLLNDGTRLKPGKGAWYQPETGQRVYKQGGSYYYVVRSTGHEARPYVNVVYASGGSKTLGMPYWAAEKMWGVKDPAAANKMSDAKLIMGAVRYARTKNNPKRRKSRRSY